MQQWNKNKNNKTIGLLVYFRYYRNDITKIVYTLYKQLQHLRTDHIRSRKTLENGSDRNKFNSPTTDSSELNLFDFININNTAKSTSFLGKHYQVLNAPLFFSSKIISIVNSLAKLSKNWLLSTYCDRLKDTKLKGWRSFLCQLVDEGK